MFALLVTSCQQVWDKLLTTCSKLVTTNQEQAVRTQLVDNLWTDLLQLVCRLVTTCAFLRVYNHASAVSIYTYEFPLYKNERVNQLEIQNESRPIVYNYFRFYSKSIVERLSEAEQESHLSNQKLRVSASSNTFDRTCVRLIAYRYFERWSVNHKSKDFSKQLNKQKFDVSSEDPSWSNFPLYHLGVEYNENSMARAFCAKQCLVLKHR